MKLGRDAFPEVFMIPLSSAVPGKLTWSKLSCKGIHELTFNGNIVGTLNRASIWSARFIAETQDGQWVFRRSGFLLTGSEITNTNSDEPIAAYKTRWGGSGTLSFADGQIYRVQYEGFWRPTLTVGVEGGPTIIRLHVREKTAELAEGASIPEARLSLLIMFALYHTLRLQEDAAMAAAVASVG
jgi:hypothetical protein